MNESPLIEPIPQADYSSADSHLYIRMSLSICACIMRMHTRRIHPPGSFLSGSVSIFAQASADRVWHLEVRWLMCAAPQIEDLVKYCARKARRAGLLLIQLPTDRRPRPFAPQALVRLEQSLQPRAAQLLCEEAGFVRERDDRWVHELGVAFVRRDPQRRGFLWNANRLLPSEAARQHSETLLNKFRSICDELELDPELTADSGQNTGASPR